MYSNLELYGTEDVPKIPEEVANVRIKLLEKHRDRLLKWHPMCWPMATLNNIDRSIAFWESLKRGENP